MQNYFGHATINKNVRRTFKQNEALSEEKRRKYLSNIRIYTIVCLQTMRKESEKNGRDKRRARKKNEEKKLHASNLKKKYHKNIKQSATTPNRKHWGFHLPFVLVCFTPLKLEFLRDFLHSHTHYHPEHLVFGAAYGSLWWWCGAGAGEVGSMRLYQWHGHYHTTSRTHLSFTRSLCIIQSLSHLLCCRCKVIEKNCSSSSRRADGG